MKGIICLCLLLAAQGVQAEPAVELTATAVATSSGTSGTGFLHAVVAGHPDGMPAPSFGDLSLIATRLLVETDVDQRNVSLLGLAPTEPWTYSEASEYRGASISTLGTGSDTQVFIAPLAGAELTYEATAVRIAPADGAVAEKRRALSERPVTSIDVEDAQCVEASERMTVWLNGSFLMVLWDWDLAVEDANGSATIDSGEEREQVLGTGGVHVVERITYRQTYIQAEGAQAVLQIRSPEHMELFVGATTVSAGRVVLSNATGTAAGIAVSGQEVELDGASSIQVDTAGRRLSITAQDAPHGMSIDGMRVPTSSKDLLPWWMLAPVLMLPALALAAQGRRKALLNRATLELDAHHYQEAHDLLKGHHVGRRFSFQAGVINVVALLRMDRTGEAAAVLERLRPRNPEDRAVVEYLHAYRHGLEDNDEEASRHVRESLRLDPRMRADLLHSPLLARLVRQTAPEGSEAYA